MRYIIYTLLMLFSVPSISQKIEENKVDEFTKNSIKRTSWEPISRAGVYSYTRVSKINNSVWLDMKIMLNNVVISIKEGGEIMFKLSNDSIVTLKNNKFTLSCKGCGAIGLVGSAAEGIETSLLLNNENIEMLKNNTVKKVRIYFSDGYKEFDVKEKFAEIIKKELELISN